uniref:Prolyl 4-hydroxylase alpha subunit domain-containing protein n=1 Tax=Anopheles quadriannulatus TaxID=34691 RepID=A0A182WSJ3_ANOQN
MNQKIQCLLVIVVAVTGIGAKDSATRNGAANETNGGEERVVTIRMDPYMDLCRGVYVPPPSLTSSLFCWYDVRNAHSVISPSKVEALSNDPFVALFHEFVHDGEIAQLQALGSMHIMQSGPSNDSWLPVFYENHQTYTLHDRDHPVVERLTKRIERRTGLSCDTAEDLKVIYNEVGAFKTAALDAIHTKEDAQRFAYAGDRLATMLFFLSDVTNGGYTIFPKLRVAIRPQKGTAAFWYNLKDTGEGNVQMKYSICPLQDDQKWTAKKLIHTRGNELRQLCRPESAPKSEK